MEDIPQYIHLEHHVFRIDSDVRFEATQVMLRVNHLNASEPIRWN